MDAPMADDFAGLDAGFDQAFQRIRGGGAKAQRAQKLGALGKVERRHRIAIDGGDDGLRARRPANEDQGEQRPTDQIETRHRFSIHMRSGRAFHALAISAPFISGA